MNPNLTPELVWDTLQKEIFGVLGMVTHNGESRTSGVVYVVSEKKLYIAVRKDAWKAAHIQRNPHVSMTIPIHKRIPLIPWIKIPAATITFSGTGAVHSPGDIPPDVLHKLFQGSESDPATIETTVVLSVSPEGQFITYGVGVPLLDMRIPEKAAALRSYNPTSHEEITMASQIYPGRFTAQADQDFVVFLIGMRINKFWNFRKWMPVAGAMGPMVRTLYEHPEKGFFAAENFFNGRTSLMLSYWESFEALEDFSRNPSDPHLAAWQAFRKAVGDDGAVGIWHETYLVRSENYECIYGNMPRFGLANAFGHIPVTKETLTARKRMRAASDSTQEKILVP